MPETTFQFIECEGTPFEMGRQYGEKAREAIRTNIRWRQREGDCRAEQKCVDTTRAFLSQHAPEVLEELEGLAEGSDVPLKSLILENAVGTPMSAGCTSMAVSPGEEGSVLGKNNDGGLNERCWVLRRTNPARGLPLVQMVSAGWLSGLDAMNAAGLANGHNSVGSAFERVSPSIEIRLWMYHMMQHCSSVEELVEGLHSVPLNGKGFNIVVADANGSTRVLECAVPKVVERGREDPFVYATNHYMSEELADMDGRTPGQKRVSSYRYGYLSWQNEMNRPTCEKDIRALLRSHEPWAPCRHGGAHKSHTLWSIVAVPEERRMEVAFGPPCTEDYDTYGGISLLT
mgnify:CR=1 FL=1